MLLTTSLDFLHYRRLVVCGFKIFLVNYRKELTKGFYDLQLECDMLRSSAQKKAATPDVAVEAVTDQTHQMNDLLVLDSCSIVQKDVACVQQDVATGGFLIPDLNMMPSEGDFGAEALYGVS